MARKGGLLDESRPRIHDQVAQRRQNRFSRHERLVSDRYVPHRNTPRPGLVLGHIDKLVRHNAEVLWKHPQQVTTRIVGVVI